MLVSGCELYKIAEKGKFAIGSFNFCTLTGLEAELGKLDAEGQEARNEKPEKSRGETEFTQDLHYSVLTAFNKILSYNLPC